MVARDRSHWFVVEVELVSHSLEGHVLPQVRAFRYGEPHTDCAMILSRELGIDLGEAGTLVSRVPRAVLVVANRLRTDWEHAIRAHQGQLLVCDTVSGPHGTRGFRGGGSLAAVKESLGFGTYSAQDGMIRFKAAINLPDGHIQMEISGGGTSLWKVIRDERFAWVVKDAGRLDIPDGSHIQLIRAIDGRITLRV